MSNRKYDHSIYDTRPVSAIYTPQLDPMHRGVPFIEALENFLLPEEIMGLTGSQPPYAPEVGQLGTRFDRLSMLLSCLGSWRNPLTTDVQLYVQLRNLAAKGYIRNNPLRPGYYDDIEDDIEENVTPLVEPTEGPLPYLPPDVSGFLVIGDSGNGKTTSTAQIWRLLRQV